MGTGIHSTKKLRSMGLTCSHNRLAVKRWWFPSLMRGRFIKRGDTCELGFIVMTMLLIGASAGAAAPAKSETRRIAEGASVISELRSAPANRELLLGKTRMPSAATRSSQPWMAGRGVWQSAAPEALRPR